MHLRPSKDRPPPRPPEKRRILIAGRCSETIYRQRRVLAHALKKAGWDVHLCGDASDQNHVEALVKEGFPFHPLILDQKAKSPVAAVRLVLAYRRLVRALRPDIVHVFNAKPTIVGLLGATLAGPVARVATIAGLGHVFMARSKIVRIAGQVAFRLALSLADAVVFYNRDDRQIFLDRKLVSPAKTHLIEGSGVDLRRFAPLPLPAGDRLEVLFIGRLLREKGIVEVIAAGRELRQRGIDVRITVVGDIDRHNPSSLSRADIEAAHAEGALVWEGGRRDVVPAIAASDVILLPSYREGIPLALVEGAAMGRALIATDVAGCREVVEQGRNGLLVTLGDRPALVDALIRLAQDRALVAQFGAFATRRANERFGAEAVSARMAALYQTVLLARKRHSYDEAR